MANKSTFQIDQRVANVEKDLLFLKRMFFYYLASREALPKTDQQVWQKIKKDYENIQETLFKKRYPSLYAKIKK